MNLLMWLFSFGWSTVDCWIFELVFAHDKFHCLLCRFHAIIIFSTRSRDQTYCQWYLFEMFSTVVIWLWLFVRWDGNRLNWNQIVMIIVFWADHRGRHDNCLSFCKRHQLHLTPYLRNIWNSIFWHRLFIVQDIHPIDDVLDTGGEYWVISKSSFFILPLFFAKSPIRFDDCYCYRYFNISIKSGLV